MSLQELEQDPFDVDEFIERLAWRTSGGASRVNPDDFDPWSLHAAFEKTIKDLKELNVKTQKKIDKLEAQCKDEEKNNWQKVTELQKSNQAAFSQFQGLDERINFVATKVVHLGDQLEGVNTPRARAVEAQLLMNYFSEFLGDEPLKSAVFTDPFQLQLAADIIQKLYMLAQELPSGPQFDKARQRISEKYDQIERDLIEEFVQAHHEGDKKRMKRVAGMLSHFKGYNQCIDAFVEESQKGIFVKEDVFIDVLPLCMKTAEVINEVFTNPEMVTAKLLLNIFHGKLQEHISANLQDRSDPEKYLSNLHTLYTKTTKLCIQLSMLRVGSDANFLNKLTKHIFAKYLETYISIETRYLRDKCSMVLHRYYEAKNHQKKQISSGGMHDFRRDIQAKIGTKTNINLGPTIENYGGETFLSQEVAINLLQESKMAFKRCQVMSSHSDMSVNATRVFDILIQFLCVEHIDYALDLGLQAIPLSDPKNQPEIYFLDVVSQANATFHLFEKQFSDSLVPLVSSTSRHSECLQKKRELMELMENRMDLGLDRTLTAMVGYTKYIFTTEQKKADFKPEDDSNMQLFSPACAKVSKYLYSQVQLIKESLDGKNVEAVLTELGTRFHRVVYEHLQQFQYNSMGAMLAICDVNEYRKCMKEFHIPLVTHLFDTLHSLCNLLVVVPENLKHACTGEMLAGLDKSVLLSFVQLRADYKTAKLVNYFK